jgi:acetyl esterase/lipase
VETFTFGGAPDAPLQLDVYRQPQPARAAVVVVHGGAWLYGDKGENAAWSRWLAAQGYLVVDVQYRLAGRATWRDAVEDIHQAIGWVREYQHVSGVETSPITLLGRSAGGHLALLAAYATDDARLPTRVIAFYAPADLEQLHTEARGPLAEDLRNGIEALAGASTYRAISPVDRARPGSPPTLLVHGTWDSDVPVHHSEALASALRMADVPVELVRVPFAVHGFDMIPQGIATHMSRQAVLRFLGAAS